MSFRTTQATPSSVFRFLDLKSQVAAQTPGGSMSRTIALLVCFLFNAAACLAQSVGGQLQSYQADLTLAKKTEAESQARREAVKNLVNARFHPQRFVLFAMGYDEVLLQQMLSLWDQSRVDKQIGSTATGSASTDLVSLPSTPELF